MCWGYVGLAVGGVVGGGSETVRQESSKARRGQFRRLHLQNAGGKPLEKVQCHRGQPFAVRRGDAGNEVGSGGRTSTARHATAARCRTWCLGGNGFRLKVKAGARWAGRRRGRHLRLPAKHGWPVGRGRGLRGGTP